MVGRAMVLAPVMVAVVAAEVLRRCTPTRRTRTLLWTHAALPVGLLRLRLRLRLRRRRRWRRRGVRPGDTGVCVYTHT